MLKKELIFAFIITFFIGCGGGGSSNTSVADDSVDSISGKVIDGEIVGARVFLDLNKNSIFDSQIEPTATTNSSGKYKLLLKKEHIEHINYINKSAFLIATNGYDLKTKEPFKGELRATIDSKIKDITPMSSLIAYSIDEENLSDLNQSADIVKEKLAKVVNVDKSILEKNPIELAIKGETLLLNASYQIIKFQDLVCKESFSSDDEIKSCYQLVYKEVAKKVNSSSEIKEVSALIEETSKDLSTIKSEVKDSAKIFSKNIEEKIKASSLYNSDSVTKAMYEIEEIQTKFSTELKKVTPSIDESWSDAYKSISLSDDYIKKLNVKKLLTLGNYKVSDTMVDVILAFKDIKLDIDLNKFKSYMDELNRLDNFIDDIKLKKVPQQ